MKPLLVVWLFAAALLSSCTTFYDAQFSPTPLEVKLEDDKVEGLSGRALINVVGVRRPDSSADAPAQVEVAVLLENLGSVPFQLDAGSLQVVTSDLVAMPAGRLKPEAPDALEPGAASVVTALFPLPSGVSYHALDFSGLNLRFALRYDGRRKVVGASFERRYPRYGYYDGYGPYPYWGWWGWGWGAPVPVGGFCAY